MDDAANRTTSVISAVGTFDLDNDDDGRLSGITFPNPNDAFGLELAYDYTRSGKPSTLRWSTADDIQLSKWTYDYKRGGADKSRLQTKDVDVPGRPQLDGEFTYSYSDERLTRATRDGFATYDHEYTYDAVGNIVPRQGVGRDLTVKRSGWSGRPAPGAPPVAGSKRGPRVAGSCCTRSGSPQRAGRS